MRKLSYNQAVSRARQFARDRDRPYAVVAPKHGSPFGYGVCALGMCLDDSQRPLTNVIAIAQPSGVVVQFQD